jgi:hypothetical protein
MSLKFSHSRLPTASESLLENSAPRNLDITFSSAGKVRKGSRTIGRSTGQANKIEIITGLLKLEPSIRFGRKANDLRSHLVLGTLLSKKTNLAAK